MADALRSLNQTTPYSIITMISCQERAVTLLCSFVRRNRVDTALNTLYSIVYLEDGRREGHGTRLYSSCCGIFRIGLRSSGDGSDELGRSAAQRPRPP